MKNLDVRQKAKECKIHLWQIADELGITDFVLSKKLRYELSEEEKEEIFKIIDEISRKGAKTA